MTGSAGAADGSRGQQADAPSRALPTGAQWRLAGRLRVRLPPTEAFRLFTPLGEQEWVPGWEPRFPFPAADDSRPGTVFETPGHGQRTIWLVLDREPGRRIRYARVTPDHQAGTVTVALHDAGGGHTDVHVTYEMTALSGEAQPALRSFAKGYAAYLRSWEEAINARHNG